MRICDKQRGILVSRQSNHMTSRSLVSLLSYECSLVHCTLFLTHTNTPPPSRPSCLSLWWHTYLSICVTSSDTEGFNHVSVMHAMPIECCHLGWGRKRRCCLFMEGWQPRTYFFSDEYYYTYFAFSVLQIQQKHYCWLYFWYRSPLQLSIFALMNIFILEVIIFI